MSDRKFGGKVESLKPDKEFTDSGATILLSQDKRSSFILHYGPASTFLLNNKILNREELSGLLDDDVIVTEVDVKLLYLNDEKNTGPDAWLLTLYAMKIRVNTFQLGDRVIAFNHFDWELQGRPEDRDPYFKPATIVAIHEGQDKATIRWDHGWEKNTSHGHSLDKLIPIEG